MAAVWILFVVGLIAVLLGLIPTGIEVYAYLAAYFTTVKELISKKLELRRARIAAKKDLKESLKAKKEAEKVEVAKAEAPVEASVAYTPAEPVATAPITPATQELAKDILNGVL